MASNASTMATIWANNGTASPRSPSFRVHVARLDGQRQADDDRLRGFDHSSDQASHLRIIVHDENSASRRRGVRCGRWARWRHVAVVAQNDAARDNPQPRRWIRTL